MDCKALKRIISVLLFVVLVFCTAGVGTAASPDKANLTIADISKWNISINWQKTAKNIDGIIARIGYRGSVYRDNLVEDPMFASHFSGATSVSLPFGCYFFSTALNEKEAEEEALWVIKTLKAYKCKPDLPVYIDMEDSTVQNTLSNKQRTAIAKTFCDTLYKNGYYPGLYANKYWLTSLINASELKNCTIWVAQYASQCSYKGEYDMWQYTETGTIDGIPGNVDINKCYRDFSSFIKKYGFNGYTGTEVIDPDKEDVTDTSKFGTYKLTATSLNVRSGAGTEYRSLGTLKNGSEVYVYAYKDGWGQISFSNDVGWISLNQNYSGRISKYISLKNGVGFYEVNTDTLNIRSGASTSYSKLGTLSLGDTVFITSVSGKWGSFYLGNGAVGWISLDYADFIGTVCFDGNGASGGMSHQLIEKGKSENLKKNNFKNGDKKFCGWATSASGSAVYSDGASFKMGTCNTVLYAVFKSGGEFSFIGGAAANSNTKTVTVGSAVTAQSDFVAKYLSLKNGMSAKIMPKKGFVISTGAVIEFFCDGELKDKYTVALPGDINGDGICDGLDISDAAAYIYGTKKAESFSFAEREAMDINRDGKIDLSDMEMFKNSAYGF